MMLLPPPRPSSSASSYQIEVKLGVGKNEGRAENVKGEHFSLDECEKSGSVGVAGVGRRRQLLDKNGLTPPPPLPAATITKIHGNS